MRRARKMYSNDVEFVWQQGPFADTLKAETLQLTFIYNYDARITYINMYISLTNLSLNFVFIK